MLPAEPPVINRLLGRTLLLPLSATAFRQYLLAGRKADATVAQVFEKPMSFSRVCRTMRFVQLFFRLWEEASREPAEQRSNSYACLRPARLLLWFVQLCLLVFGQALLDDFQLLKSIFEHRLFRVFLGNTDRRQQDGFCGQQAVRHLRPAVHVLVPREIYRGFSRGPRLIPDRLIDGHQLRASEDSFDGSEVCVLARDQHSA